MRTAVFGWTMILGLPWLAIAARDAGASPWGAYFVALVGAILFCVAHGLTYRSRR